MEEKQGQELIRTLDTIKRLLAYQVAQGHKTLESKAGVLSSLGLQPREIAVICGTTAATVSTRLAEAKKKGAGRKRR